MLFRLKQQVDTGKAKQETGPIAVAMKRAQGQKDSSFHV
jgi:hypothetical protein